MSLSQHRITSLFLIPLLFVVVEARSQEIDPFFVIELWVELDPIVADGTERPLPQEVAVDRMLDEAQETLSGLVYGYRFEYYPGDPARGTQEMFELEPHARIIRGDPRLRVLQTWAEGDSLYSRMSYTMDEAQTAWFRGWHSSAQIRTAGTGRSPVILGAATKPQALPDGVRMAIRNYARQVEFNRPQLITGAAILAEPPRYTVREGHYEAEVAIYLQIDRIVPYRVY